ncbi:MAG: RNA polymerase sigma factor [Candidatus Rokubacteria bacterium]|nr:RNA polymerase sigma factor [Candidatus Rokubacteria bacterium]
MDDTAFETMVATHHGEIYRYLLRATGRTSDADDLSQETFLRAYRAYRSLPEDANARAWLFTIATNLSRNHFRAQKRRRRAYEAVGAMASDTDGTGPEGVTLSREVGAVVEAAISGLPFKQRLAFLQRKVHGHDYDTIGQSLHCSPESARAHVFQALRKIRRALNGRELLAKESNR